MKPLIPRVFAAAIIAAPIYTMAEPPSPVPAATSMSGKVFCGYQGWYRTPGDGSGLGYMHYETYGREFEPGKCGIDYWPDMSEATKEEKYPTPFRHADGTTAKVFSSAHPKTVDRHFAWMKEHGIDGIFLQRFVNDVLGDHRQKNQLFTSNNKILANCKAAAQKHGRAYALMYDLSGCNPDEVTETWEDWKKISTKFELTKDPNYLRHKGKPVVAIWGVGFSGGDRDYGIAEARALVRKFRDAPGEGYTIVLGVPTFWRDRKRDALPDPALHDLIKEADVVLPWMVGRFRAPEGAAQFGKMIFEPDLAWCRKNDLDYLPVIFPGFSWANRKNVPENFDQAPRLGGRFLWSQAVAAKKAGASMIYVAMFDEMDEGTQIFKVTSDPPVGASRFLSYAPEDPDFYLRLTGEIGRLLRGTIPPTPHPPIGNQPAPEPAQNR